MGEAGIGCCLAQGLESVDEGDVGISDKMHRGVGPG
jgi:hypothetical protein